MSDDIVQFAGDAGAFPGGGQRRLLVALGFGPGGPGLDLGQVGAPGTG